MNPQPASALFQAKRRRELKVRKERAAFYAGVWVDDEPCVTVTRGTETVPLPRRERFSPLGFGWGYSGPACAHLAYAILADFLASEPDGESRTQRVHEEFQSCVVAGLPGAWALSADNLADFLAIVDL